jgi:Rieske Fe-S protein
MAEETPKKAAEKQTSSSAKNAAAPAVAPKGKKAAEKEGKKVSRRGFFSWAAVGWVGFTAAIGGCVNSGGSLYALIAICTHLGCPPNWLEAQNKFKCPCHGSGYYKDGINFEGPTPRPLERAKIFLDPDDGQIVIDKSQIYQWEMGQWEDPDSFIQVV